MSAIYGFFTHNIDDRDTYLNILRAWNSDYGKELRTTSMQMNENIPSHITLEACLDHFRSSIPNQKGSLSYSDTIAVIDYPENELPNVALINGDFAGVLYDKKKECFYLFRDHLGIRPLYYMFNPSGLYFSTDIRGLLALPGFDYHVNEEELFLQLMCYSTISPTRTAFTEINYVKAASFHKITTKGNIIESDRPKEYFTLGKNKIRLPNDNAYRTELRRLIEDATKRRMDARRKVV